VVLAKVSDSPVERLARGVRYSLYRHYFPMMALGRFIRLSEEALTMTDGISKGDLSRHDSLQSIL
jgi:hypothetical protein